MRFRVQFAILWPLGACLGWLLAEVFSPATRTFVDDLVMLAFVLLWAAMGSLLDHLRRLKK